MRIKISNRIGKRKKILKLAKGFFGARNQFRSAKKAVLKAIENKKKSYKLNRRLDRVSCVRMINSALIKHNINYSTFIVAMRKHNIEISRNALKDMIVSYPSTFNALIGTIF